MVLSQTHSHEGPAQLLHGQLREWSRTYCVARQLNSLIMHICVIYSVLTIRFTRYVPEEKKDLRDKRKDLSW